MPSAGRRSAATGRGALHREAQRRPLPPTSTPAEVAKEKDRFRTAAKACSWKQIKVQELEAGYNDGTYDCTWLCVACFGKRLGITDEEKVAREIGVYGNETHRQTQWSKQSYR